MRKVLGRPGPGPPGRTGLVRETEEGTGPEDPEKRDYQERE